MTNLIVLLFAYSWVLPSAIAFLLLLFHKTHFVVEYANLFGLGKFVYAEEFTIWEKENPEVGYPVFLAEEHNNFFTRMLRCPWCLITWLSILLNIIVIHTLITVFGVWNAILFGWIWTFSIGYSAIILYFFGLIVYNKVFPPKSV